MFIALLLSTALTTLPCSRDTIDPKTGNTAYGDGYSDASRVLFNQELYALRHIRTMDDVRDLRSMFEQMDTLQKSMLKRKP